MTKLSYNNPQLYSKVYTRESERFSFMYSDRTGKHTVENHEYFSIVITMYTNTPRPDTLQAIASAR